jgi:hypothetical protein
MSTPTLESLLARIDTWVLAQPRAIEERLARPSTKVSGLPPTLATLFAWRDGERGAGGVFSGMLLPDYEAAWRAEVESGTCQVRFLGQAAARLLDHDVFIGGETCTREPGPGAKAAKLIPFVALRSPLEGGDADDGEDDIDEEGDFSGDVDEWLLCVDSLQEQVWLLQYPDDLDDRECIVHQAPSLAAFFEPLVARLETGAVSLDLPADELPEDPEAEATRTAKLLVTLLLQQELIELADDVMLDEVADRLESRLLKKPRAKAVEAVVAFFDDDPTIGEIYIDPEELHVIVEEFI